MALLRGVNLGGARKLPMRRLAAMFEAAGAEAVETYVQSGNVVFVAPAARAAPIAAEVARGIEREFGFAAPMALRDARAWSAVIADNPFVAEGAPEAELHALSLTRAPDGAALARLEPPPPSGRDAFRVRGATVYLRLPDGVARTKLTTAWFDSRLGCVSTQRNWRTVLALGALIAARAAR